MRSIVYSLSINALGTERTNARNGATTVVTLSAVPSNRTLVMMFGWADNNPRSPSIADNAAGSPNTYTIIPQQNVDGEWWGAAYCTNVIGSPTTVTLTVPSNGASTALQIDVYSESWNFFQSTSGTSAGAGVVTPTPILPPVSGCLIYGTCIATLGSGCAPHTGNGFTQRVTWVGVGAAEELIQAHLVRYQRRLMLVQLVLPSRWCSRHRACEH